MYEINLKYIKMCLVQNDYILSDTQNTRGGKKVRKVSSSFYPKSSSSYVAVDNHMTDGPM